MNTKISVFVICVEAIIYLFLYNLHDCAFKVRSRLTEALTLLGCFPHINTPLGANYLLD